MNDLRDSPRGVWVAQQVAAELLRTSVFGARARNNETRGVVRPSPDLVQLWHELDAVANGATPIRPAHAPHPVEVVWVGASEAAEVMGCSTGYVRRCCRDGKVPGARQTNTGRWLIPVPKSELAAAAS